MEKIETYLNEASESESHHSPLLNTAHPINVAISRGSQNPVMWGDVRKTIRHLLPDEILTPGDVDVAQAYAGPSKPEPKSLAESKELSPMASGTSSERSEGAQEGVTENDVMADGSTISEPEHSDHWDDDVGDKFVIRCRGIDKARDIAAQALAAISEEDENSQSTTPPESTQREPTSDAPLTFASSPSTPKFLRSPIWRNLVTVSPPPNGYWTPSSTEEGEKNTPMCPPCRTGKKGRCFGGLPCDRCREKGYSKERCEGSVVFRFSPRTKRGAGEREQMRKKSPVDSARWKRDAFGRFV